MSTSYSRRRFLSQLALASTAVSSLALSACGAPQQKKANSLEEITFVLDYSPNTNHSGIYLAKERGYFSEAGFELSIEQPPEDGADFLVGSGKAQFGVSYQDTMANYLASSAPLPLSAVAAIIQHNTSGIMSRKKDGIVRPRLLEHHRYATWTQEVEQAIIKHLVEHDGGDFSKVELIPYNASDEVAGLATNSYDAVWVFEAWGVQNARVQDFDYEYWPLIAFDSVFDYYTPVIIANDEYLKQHKDRARAFLAACKRGYIEAIKDPDAAASALLKAVPELDEKLVRASQGYLSHHYSEALESWGSIDPERWNKFYRWMNEQKLVKQPLKDNAGLAGQFLE